MSDFPSKAGLRRQISARLKNLSTKDRQSGSEKVCANLTEENFFKNAQAVLFFAPLENEPDIWPLLTASLVKNKIAALLCFDARAEIYKARRVKDISVEIVSGKFGIREPATGCVEVPLADLDLALVPGLAFDLRGSRLGRGKGFYDRLLENFCGKKIGIAFDEQIIAEVPAENWDVKMDFLVTPAGCVKI